ncbi:hypothetical protein AB0O91_28415 [Kitasatospora sp. NPDC089797]|uniref:hypothetical protein n=1 Tax=Kitasatospora sp. NPDC089797 TaxID=3155298 RepID=UPI0034136F0C
MSPHPGSARALRAGALLLALPLLGVSPAAAAVPAPRPMAPCADGTDGAQHVHHRPLPPPPALVVGGPVRRSPARPCP